MSDKKYGSRERNEREDFFERRAKKKAMRDQHKDRWRFSPTNSYGEEDDNEVDDREGYLTG